MNNYDDVISQLCGFGLLIDLPLEIDSPRSVRCFVEGEGRERRGWYWLHRKLIRLDGPGDSLGDMVEVLVGAYGVYHGNDPNTQKIKVNISGRAHKFSADDAAAIRARHEADRKRVASERIREADRAARRAASVWAKALLEEAPDGVTDYLARKGVANYGLRYTPSGSLVVPMHDTHGSVRGLQFILPSQHPRRKKTGRDKEYWPQGLTKQGCYFLLGSPACGSVCLIAEGYATAATLHAATGLPVAVAFDAGNLLPVAQALQKHYRRVNILICADDDCVQTCAECKALTNINSTLCAQCGKPHRKNNAGVAAAQNAALAVSGQWVAPDFPGDRGLQKLSDFNDLQQYPAGGLSLVRSQIEARIRDAGWDNPARLGLLPTEGAGGAMKPLLSVDEAVLRYSLIYGGKGAMFDHADRILVHKDDVLNITPDHCWREWKTRSDRSVVRIDEVGFDPTEQSAAIRCNLWGGWPTVAAPGVCDNLLALLRYLCSGDDSTGALAAWVLKWLAYPIQHPGAKMHSAVVVHGPQGTGKSRFFEAVADIYGEYGLVLDQGAIEDRFNSDWASKRLFVLADEIVARQDMYHIKNRLKTFITGKTIRINPKSLTAYTESNHMNLVFLSNEKMPLALENDDRRHCVIWTPPKPPDAFFADVNAEVDAGGVAALHHFLQHLDLGDFRPWTYPPMTNSKADLIALGVGSEERFIDEWRAGEIGKPFCPCASSQLYAAYKTWAAANGVPRIRESNQFFGFVAKMPGWQKNHKDVYENTHYRGSTKRQRMVVPSDADMAAAATVPGSDDYRRREDQTQAQWLTDCYFAFQSSREMD